MAKIGLARVLEALEQDGYQGFCLACGADAYGVEPDAENYECEECGKAQVFGAEQVLCIIG